MNQQAFKYLAERLKKAAWQEVPQQKDPAPIRVLRAQLKRYDAKALKVWNDRRQAQNRAVNAVREVLHRGEYEEALAAIKKLEARTF